jgi:Tat protein secretion system quality control protein TatD with DNase activity
MIIGSWCGKPVDFDWLKNKAEWKNISFEEVANQTTTNAKRLFNI